eukprot:569619-Pleurochrysis_carterae.AAC.1
MARRCANKRRPRKHAVHTPGLLGTTNSIIHIVIVDVKSLCFITQTSCSNHWDKFLMNGTFANPLMIRSN